MSRSVAGVDKVVVVCSGTYVEKAEGRRGGAGYESTLVTAELVANQGTSKFIPIIRGNTAGTVPSFLAGRIYVDFRDDERYDEALTTLLRAIHDLPSVDPPPVGGNPFPSHPAAPLITPKADKGPLTEEALEELLQDPNRRITLSKLFWASTEAARRGLENGNLYSFGERPSAESVTRKVNLSDEQLGPLAPLLMTGARWATREQMPTIVNSVAHFLDMPPTPGSYYESNLHLAKYPALHALYAAGLGALANDRLDNLRALLMAPVSGRRPGDHDLALVVALHSGAPFAQDVWKLLPGRERRNTPLSEHLQEKLTVEIPDVLRSEAVSNKLYDRLESLISVAYADVEYSEGEADWGPLGTFLWRNPMSFSQMTDELAKMGTSWPPLKAGFFGGSADRAAAVLTGRAAFLSRVRHQRGIY